MSGGGVLQQLMAESSYRTNGNRNGEMNNEMPSSIPSSQRVGSPYTPIKQTPPQYKKTPPRRALSDESPIVENSQSHPYLNTSSRSAELTTHQFSNGNLPAPHTPSPRAALANASGLLSRLRKEFLNKPSPGQMQAKQTHYNSDSNFETVDNKMSMATHANFGHINNFPSTSSPKQRFHGHPKSNSAGEEFLYTDRKAKLISNKGGRRRGKNAASIMRSRSLHYDDESTAPHVVQRRAATDLGIGAEHYPTLGAPRKKSDASTMSSGSVASDKQTSLSHSSSAGDNAYFQIALHEDNIKADLSKSVNLNDSANAQYHNHPISTSMVLTPSGMGGLPQQPMGGNNPHGPYYATVPVNPITAPRGPPPPYPQGATIDESQQPQRPNSLQLGGQVSRKKMEYGGGTQTGGLTSPAISTNAPISVFSYPMSAGTPVHGFYALSQDMPPPVTTTSNGSNNTILQGYQGTQQPPQSQFRRTGSGNAFQMISTTQAQHIDIQAYTNNNAGTPIAYQQRHDNVVNMRTQVQQQHTAPQKQLKSTSPIYGQQVEFQAPTNVMNYPPVAGATTGFSLGKSDSVNSNASTSSSGSRIARRAKRNSKNFSNTSGSSSSTGNSRPNSSADYLDKIQRENDSLHARLQAANQKLKKLENVEKELLRISEEYKASHISVSKSEQMEKVLRDQLKATNTRTQQENDILRERIDTLSELVVTLQSTNKDAQTASSSDIMMYKVKVQELENKERILNKQLEDANERISEQDSDMALKSSTLERVRANVATWKEKYLEKQRADQYVEQLSPWLDMLSKTVQARIQAESELGETVGIQQRRSTSSNDEGISGMESAESSQNDIAQSSLSSSQSSTLTRDEQLIRTHAQMLKWQHMYLQATILRQLQSGGSASGENSPISTMLHRHRHAVSDPSSQKRMVFDLPQLNAMTSLMEKDVDIRRAGDVTTQSPKTNRKDKTTEQSKSTRRRRCDTSPTTVEKSNDDSNNVTDHTNSKAEEMTQKRRVSNDEVATTNNASNENDSEGYHSQQSSGSPTPSSERSSVHFPENDSRVTAALADAPTPQTNTTKSPEVYVVSSANSAAKTVLKVADV